LEQITAVQETLGLSLQAVAAAHHQLVLVLFHQRVVQVVQDLTHQLFVQVQRFG
jgi:hypothetical protein